MGNRQELKQKVLDETPSAAKRNSLIDFVLRGRMHRQLRAFGVLVSLSKKIREQGGKLRLANLE